MNESLASGTPPTADFPMVSASRFLHSFGNNREGCIEILEVALEESEAQIRKVLSLETKDDLESVRLILHSLRGAASSFKAERFVELLLMLEAECRAGKFGTVLAMLEHFEAQSACYRTKLRQLLEEIQAL